MPSKGDGAGTDTFRPQYTYGRLLNTENRQRLRVLATAALMPPLRLIAVPPCSLSPLPDKDFYDRPATCRLFQQSTGRDSDNPPSCVVGLSQTPPAGTELCHLLFYLRLKNLIRFIMCPIERSTIRNPNFPWTPPIGA